MVLKTPCRRATRHATNCLEALTKPPMADDSLSRPVVLLESSGVTSTRRARILCSGLFSTDGTCRRKRTLRTHEFGHSRARARARTRLRKDDYDYEHEHEHEGCLSCGRQSALGILRTCA